MRKSLTMLLCVSMSYGLMAQDTDKQKEVGIVFNNLNFEGAGLTYRFGSSTALWRFNALILSGFDREVAGTFSSEMQSRFGYGASAGKELRTVISDIFELRYGLDLSFNYVHTSLQVEDQNIVSNNRSYLQTTYSPGINLVLGFNFVLKNNILIGAEVLPYIRYNTGTRTVENAAVNNGIEEVSDISGFEYGLSNSSVLFSIGYRFTGNN